MATSFGALCSDFSISHKLSLKMDLPPDRETILHLMDRVRKSVPSMSKFHPYENELVLESSRRDMEYRAVSLSRRAIRSTFFNPPTLHKAYTFHKLILELAPYHLTISPLDVDCLDLTLEFDLECKANHDEIVYEALYGESHLAGLLRLDGARVLDVQPYFNIALDEKGSLQAFFEVKTRNRSRRGGSSRFKHEPISIFLTVRRFGPIDKVEDLQDILKTLGQSAELLAAERLVPHLLMPISRQITSSSA
ncbi:MAG: hypothetical protein WD768_11985 [Phycisphaeraceae bacterium]